MDLIQIYPGPPADALEEVSALTDPSLSLFNGDEKGTLELDERPILRLTQFGIYDEACHFCALDVSAIEANRILHAYGYVKPVWSDSPGLEDAIAVKEIGPVKEWFFSGFDGGKKAVVCK